MAEKLNAVKGMNDILPPDSARWEWLEEKVRDLMARYAYRLIRTPIVEPTALFVRGTGETTDIVEKEMYSFVDRLNGEQLTLRPENTPGVVRAAIEHNLTYDGGKRLYYLGQMFRHERPQRGRYRHFYQLGAEVLGFGGPEVDAELMVLAWQLLAELGLRNVRVEINSLGIPPERHAHRAALVKYFEQHADLLDDDAKRRLHTNPLRILDTKNPALQKMVQDAPQLLGFLGEASLQRFDTVQRLLDASTRGWSAASITTAIRCSNSSRKNLAPRARCAAAAATTACSRSWVASRPRPSAGAWAWSGCWSWSGSRAPRSHRRHPMPTPSFPTPRRCRWHCLSCRRCAAQASACRCTPAARTAWAA